MRARGIAVAAVLAVALVLPEQTAYRTRVPEIAALRAATQRQGPKPGFLSFRADASYPFRPGIGTNPERVCDRLDEAGFSNMGWRASEVLGVWECMAVVDEATAAEKANDNSIFYLLRGTGSRRIKYARLKINVPDPDASAQTLLQAQEFMRTFAGAADFDAPPDLLDAIGRRSAATIILRDVSFKLKPEFDDPDRLNLSIEFGPTLNAFYRRPNTIKITPPLTPSSNQRDKGSRLRKNDQ